jgi:hypothetical protein
MNMLVNSQPDALAACILKNVVTESVFDWFTVSVSLPHYLELAEIIEARRSIYNHPYRLGVPIPILTAPGMARLWSKWCRVYDGSAILNAIEIRAGEARTGERIMELRRRRDGVFNSTFFLYKDAADYQAKRARLLATCHALDAFAALADKQDAVAAVARMSATSGFCICCGRALTDPRSRDLGAGPGCADLMRKVAREVWQRHRVPLLPGMLA